MVRRQLPLLADLAAIVTRASFEDRGFEGKADRWNTVEVIKAYKTFRAQDQRQRRRVVILTNSDKDARALPKALGAKQEKKKVKSPRMAVGSGKQANWEWRGLRVFSSRESKRDQILSM